MVFRALNQIIALVFCLGGFSKAQNLPNWFYYPPNHQNYYFGIGVSNKYSDYGTAFSSARSEALFYIAHQIEFEIIGKLADVSSGSKSLSRTYIQKKVNPLLVDKIRKSIEVIDSVIINNEAYMLVAVNKNLSKPVKLHYEHNIDIQKTGIYKPKWTYRPPRKKGYIYGVGLGVRHKNTKDTWNDSAQNAYIEIAEQKKSDIKSMYLKRTSNYTQDIEWIEQKTDIILNNSRIIERWYDKKTDLYYTLVEHKSR